MKKYILLGTLISAFTVLATNIDIRLGRDLTTNISTPSEIKSKSKVRGLEFAYEVTSSDYTKFSYGMGLAATGSKVRIDNYRNAYEKSTSYPIYLIGLYNLKPENTDGLRPYIKGKLGMAINNKTMSYKEGNINSEMKYRNGFYAGIGAGVRTKNYTTYELSYNMNFFKAQITKTEDIRRYGSYGSVIGRNKISDEKFSARKGALTFSVGITFPVD